MVKRTAISMCSIYFSLVQDGARRLSFRFNPLSSSLTFSACFQGLDWNRQGKGGNLRKTSLQHVASFQHKNKPVQTPSCCCQSRHIQWRGQLAGETVPLTATCHREYRREYVTEILSNCERTIQSSRRFHSSYSSVTIVTKLRDG